MEQPELSPNPTPTPKKGKPRANTWVFGTMMAVCVACLLCLALLLRIKNARSRGTAFCCPDQVELLAGAINRSLDPCRDFHSYVCSNFERLSLAPYLSKQNHFLYEVRQGDRVDSSRAKHILWQYDQSCLNSIRPLKTLASDLAAGIIEELGVTAQMNRKEMAHFLLRTNLVYDIDNVITVAVSRSFSRVHSTNFILTSCQPCVKATASVFNSRLATNVTYDDIIAYALSVEVNDYRSRPANKSVLMDLFPDVSQDAWNKIQEEARKPLRDDIPILLSNVTILRTLLISLANPDNQPASIAFMVANAVFYVATDIRLPDSISNEAKLYDAIHEACFQYLKSQRYLLQLFYAAELTNATRDDHVREIYGLVTTAVSSAAASGDLFSKTDQALVKPALQKLTLILLSNFSSSGVQLPNMTNEFGRNYIRALTYEASAGRENIRRHLPRYLSEFSDRMLYDGLFYVSSTYYAASDFENPQKLVVNMAILGIRMAEAMWRHLLTNRNWSVETSSKIQNLFRCYNSSAGTDVALTTLAIGSVLNVTDRTHWNEKRQAQNTWMLSTGELFYLWHTYGLCTPTYSTAEADRVNIPMRQIEDFRTTFGCAAGSPMAEKTTC